MYDALDMAYDRTVESLIAFETEIAALFNAGQIRAPVHLSDGNEAQLLEIFREVQAQDWVCCSWRSHYHCLLKGVPPALLRAEIMAGRSIALCFPDYRIVSSAIAGGTVPIAVGLAMGEKRRGSNARVWCFLGDMVAESGIAHECVKYASRQMLNMCFVIENNGLSVCTPTMSAWGSTLPGMEDGALMMKSYNYHSRYPHAGVGERVQF